jgi:predicted nucleic acid-binding protein
VITAVDSSVLFDVFTADRTHGPRSREALMRCLAEGSLVACEVVWAEVAASFPSSDDGRRALDQLGVTFSAIDTAGALHAGAAWRSYRKRGGKRTRVIADFLIGAHAGASAERLLTRDRGFYRTYFADVVVLDPARS